MNATTLWDYPDSSASYRVRIALNIARISYRREIVDLRAKAHHSPAHFDRHPQGLVPVLDIDGQRLTQSLAIIEYLDDTRQLGLLPDDPAEKAQLRALAYIIAVDLHPVCNLSVATHATGGNEPARADWMRHFIRPALQAFERGLAHYDQGPFSTGSTPSLADLCLIPQLYNADRWGVDYSDCPCISTVKAHCATDTRFTDTAP